MCMAVIPFLLRRGKFGCNIHEESRLHECILLDSQPSMPVSQVKTCTAVWRRDFGLQLFKDEQRLRVRTLFGSLTDPAVVSERPDAAAAPLLARVAFLWAGAVLHVRASCPQSHCDFAFMLLSVKALICS